MIEEHYIDDILFVLNCTEKFASNNSDLSENENTTVNQNSLALMMTPSYQTTISKIVLTEKDIEQDKSTSWIKSFFKAQATKVSASLVPLPRQKRLLHTWEAEHHLQSAHQP